MTPERTLHPAPVSASLKSEQRRDHVDVFRGEQLCRRVAQSQRDGGIDQIGKRHSVTLRQFAERHTPFAASAAEERFQRSGVGLVQLRDGIELHDRAPVPRIDAHRAAT